MLQHGGSVCYSATGENDLHAILEGGPFYIVHPSDIAPALVALGATVKISTGGSERSVPIEKFFVSPKQDPTRENILQPNEILTEIEVPSAPAGSKARSTSRKWCVRSGTSRCAASPRW